MRTLQVIRKNNVLNYYSFGKKLQKWCKENTNIILDVAGCGFSDGGCRVLAEALIQWSNNYLKLKSYKSGNGIEHIVATFQDLELHTYILDADGMGSISDGHNKLAVLEQINCSMILSDSVGNISNYHDRFPDLIKAIVAKLENDIGTFKPIKLIAGSKIELPTHHMVDNVLIANLEYCLNGNFNDIPKLNNAKQAIDLLFRPLNSKSSGKLDYLSALRYVAIRDKFKLTDDDYIYALKKLKPIQSGQEFAKVNSILPPWGPKADKAYLFAYKDDFWQLSPSSQITLAYQIENRIGSSTAPVLRITENDGFTEFRYKDELLFETSTKYNKIDYLTDILKSDTEHFKSMLSDLASPEYKPLLINLLIHMIHTSDNSAELKTMIKEHLTINQHAYLDIYALINDLDIKNTDLHIKHELFRILDYPYSLEEKRLILCLDFMNPDWLNEYIANVDTVEWFDNLYKYPEILNNLTDETKVKLIENAIIVDNIKFHNIDGMIGEYAEESIEYGILNMIDTYIGHLPKIANMLNMAKSLNTNNPLTSFIELYKSASIQIDADISLPIFQ